MENKLKTLKDIKHKFVTSNLLEKEFAKITSETFISKEELKKEAIKWIKELLRQEKIKEYDVLTNTFMGYEVQPMITWIQHFFNIEQSDIINTMDKKELDNFLDSAETNPNLNATEKKFVRDLK